MEQQKGMFSELLSRRIPQILGMYVASAWLCIEIAEWMGERFPIPATFSSHVGLFLLVLLPAVAILAWSHGKPGKDQWTKYQILAILVNVILACWASLHFVDTDDVPPVQPPETPDLEQAVLIDQTTVVDEVTGEPVTYEVAKKGQSQKISLFFFDNKSGDESLDWLSGGASWLLSQDLKRSPFISVDTPLDSDSLRLGLQDKGFKDALNEPLSLDLQIAKNKSAQWAIKGEVYKEDDEVAFKASLYNVVTGALIKTVSQRHGNWLTALDLVSSELSGEILEKQSVGVTIPDLSIEQHVSSDLNAIKLVVEGLYAMNFNNDYNKAKEYLLASVALDANLAEAYVVQMRMHMNSGEFAEAQAVGKKALNLDYKLYDEDVFGVKAQLYAISGDEDKALKVLENWAKVYPESAEALLSLGQNYLIKGHRLADAEMAYKKLSEIEQGSKHLLRLSNVYMLQEDYLKAINSLKTYLSYEPESVPALMALGKISQRQGDFSAAAAYFEEAILASNNELEPAILFALNLGVSEDPDQAILELTALLSEAKNDQERYQAYVALEQMYLQKGQMTKALENLELSEPFSESTMPPIAHLLNHQGKKMAYLTALGKSAEAAELLLQLERDTQPPFNQMLVFMRLSFHSLQNDKEGIAKYLKQAQEVMETFKMSVYQQFIFNYEGVMKRVSQQYDEAQTLHDKAIEEGKQSILSLTTYELVESFINEKAKTYYQSKNYTEAIEALDYLIKLKPRAAEYVFLKAKILYQQGDVDASQLLIELIDTLWVDVDSDYTEYKKFKAFKESMSVE